MFRTLAKGYGPAILIGVCCGLLFNLPLWQAVALMWLAGAPLTLLLAPVPLPKWTRSNGMAPALTARTARTQSAS